MRGIGDRLHDAVLNEAPPLADPELLERAARIAARLNLARGRDPLEVWFVDFPPNAFALPGGRVYVSDELLVRAFGDAVLAFVVAHEMAHHDLGHCDALPAIDDDDGGDARVLCKVARATTRSAAEEGAADREALELCRRAGYAESGVREAFELLAAVERAASGQLRDDLGTMAIVVDCLGIARPRAPIEARRRALWGLARVAAETAVLRGFAATHMVVACARCHTRFAPRRACPSCGGAVLVDLRDARTRDPWLTAPGTSARLRLGASWFLAAIAGMLILDKLDWMAAVGWLVLVLATAEVRARFVVRRLRPHPAPALLPLHPITVRGVVRTVRATTSPLGARAAAWRLEGRASGPIDDAGVGAFDVIVDGVVAARVEADDALVDLGSAGRSGVPIDDTLAAFLRERGRLPARRRVRLAHTTLDDGDTVEVTGAAEDTLIADGYRASTLVPLFRDWPMIRKLDPGP